MIKKPQKLGGHGPHWATAPQRRGGTKLNYWSVITQHSKNYRVWAKLCVYLTKHKLYFLSFGFSGTYTSYVIRLSHFALYVEGVQVFSVTWANVRLHVKGQWYLGPNQSPHSLLKPCTLQHNLHWNLSPVKTVTVKFGTTENTNLTGETVWSMVPNKVCKFQSSGDSRWKNICFNLFKTIFVMFLQQCPSLICFPLYWQINYFKDTGFTDDTVHEDNRLQMTTSLTAQTTYVWRNNEAHLHSHWCCAKAISITHYVCVALLSSMQNTCTISILSPVACLALPHFSTLSHKCPKYQISRKYVQWELSFSVDTETQWI